MNNPFLSFSIFFSVLVLHVNILCYIYTIATPVVVAVAVV